MTILIVICAWIRLRILILSLSLGILFAAVLLLVLGPGDLEPQAPALSVRLDLNEVLVLLGRLAGIALHSDRVILRDLENRRGVALVAAGRQKESQS